MWNIDLKSVTDKFSNVVDDAAGIGNTLGQFGQTAQTVWSNWSPLFDGNNAAVNVTRSPLQQNVPPPGTQVNNNSVPEVKSAVSSNMLIYGGVGLATLLVVLVATRK